MISMSYEQAIKCEKWDVVLRHIDDGADPCHIDVKHGTPLIFKTEYHKRYDITDRLMDVKMVDPNIFILAARHSYNFSSLLSISVSNGDAGRVEKFLKHNPTPEILNAAFMSVSFDCDRQSTIKITSKLIAAGADINCRNQNGETAYYMAAKSGNNKMI